MRNRVLQVARSGGFQAAFRPRQKRAVGERRVFGDVAWR
jgi:hypothetical protein